MKRPVLRARTKEESGPCWSSQVVEGRAVVACCAHTHQSEGAARLCAETMLRQEMRRREESER